MTSNVLQQAMQLAALGLAVHWLRAPSWGGKAPVRKRWQSVPWQPPEQLRKLYRDWYNVGIRTGAVQGARFCVVVLDLDSAEALAWARANLPPTPLRVLTRRGEHWYYLRPPGGTRLPNSAHIGGQAKDVRADEGQVVCPPSRHPSGHIYSWVEPPTVALLAQVPTWDPTWFPPPRAPALSIPRLRFPSPGQSVARAREALRKMQPAVQGQNGSRTCFIAAVMLFRRFGLDVPTAYDLMWREYNPRCLPPWTEAEILHKVTDAARIVGLPDPVQQAVHS